MNLAKRNNFEFNYGRLVLCSALLPLLILTACSKGNVMAAGPAAPPPPLVTVVQYKPGFPFLPSWPTSIIPRTFYIGAVFLISS